MGNYICESKLGWNCFLLSQNPNITWEIVCANPNVSWNYICLSYNPNITWEIVCANPDYPWNYYGLSRNPNITYNKIRTNLGIINCCPSIQWHLPPISLDGSWGVWGIERINNIIPQNFIYNQNSSFKKGFWFLDIYICPFLEKPSNPSIFVYTHK